MEEIAHPIDLKLLEKLRDPTYRKKFFLAESSARIAGDLIALRKKRGLNQTELAGLIGTAQTGISRLEKSSYQSWSFSMLRRIADALDARIRVRIEPAEDVLREYESIQENKTTEGILPEEVVYTGIEDYSAVVDDNLSLAVDAGLVDPAWLNVGISGGQMLLSGSGGIYDANSRNAFTVTLPARPTILNWVTRSPWAIRLPNLVRRLLAKIDRLEAENEKLKKRLADIEVFSKDASFLDSMAAVITGDESQQTGKATIVIGNTISRPQATSIMP